MAGVGTLLKQAQKMQKQIESMQSSLEAQIIDVSSGGGAVQIKINGAGKFQAFTLGADFLQEDKKFIEETILQAVQEAALKSKARHEAEMQKISTGFQLPGVL